MSICARYTVHSLILFFGFFSFYVSWLWSDDMFRSVDLVVDGSSSTCVKSVRQVSWLLFAGRRREWHEPCNAPRCLQSLTIERVVRDFRWWNLFAWIHDVLWREREREWDRRSFFSFYPSSHGWFGFFFFFSKSFLPSHFLYPAFCFVFVFVLLFCAASTFLKCVKV